MKKSINIFQRIVEETDTGYFVVYYINKEEETYEEVMRIDVDILKPEGDPPLEFSTAFDIFDKVQYNLINGMYFCVFKGGFGAEWFTRDTSDNPQKTVLEDSNVKKV